MSHPLQATDYFSLRGEEVIFYVSSKMRKNRWHQNSTIPPAQEFFLTAPRYKALAINSPVLCCRPSL